MASPIGAAADRSTPAALAKASAAAAFKDDFPRRGGGIILVEVRVAQRAVTARTRLVRGDVRGYHVVLGAASRQPVFDELFTLLFFDDAHALKPGID